MSCEFKISSRCNVGENCGQMIILFLIPLLRVFYPARGYCIMGTSQSSSDFRLGGLFLTAEIESSGMF